MKRITLQAVAALLLLAKSISMLKGIAAAGGWNAVALFFGALILGIIGLRLAWCFDVGIVRYKNWA